VDAVVRALIHRAEHSRRSATSFSKTSGTEDDDDGDGDVDDGDDDDVGDAEEEGTMII